MSSKAIGSIVAVVAVLILGASMALWGVGVNNTEIELREQAVAQEKDNQNIYDKTWKVIKQKAQITDKYAKDFKDIYATLMNERYEGDEGDNPTFKWIHEQNPAFSVDMYKELGDSIEANRAEFARVQSRLIDIKREHDVLRKRFPSKLIVGDREELVVTIVTSDKTDDVFKAGKDNDVELF